MLDVEGLSVGGVVALDDRQFPVGQGRTGGALIDVQHAIQLRRQPEAGDAHILAQLDADLAGHWHASQPAAALCSVVYLWLLALLADQHRIARDIHRAFGQGSQHHVEAGNQQGAGDTDRLRTGFQLQLRAYRQHQFRHISQLEVLSLNRGGDAA